MSKQTRTAKTEISKQVNAILDQNEELFGGFERAKDAYNCFVAKFPKMEKFVTYDNFHYYWTKKFPSAKLSTRRASFDAPAKRAMPKTEGPVDISALTQEEDFEIKVFNPRKEKAKEEIFKPLKTGKFLDNYVSKAGGFMPGTTVVIFADGGVGKSTIGFDALYNIQKNHKKAECMAFSSEMSRTDLQAEIKQGKEWMNDVHQILMEDYKPEQYKTLIRKVLLHGYDFLTIDSFQSIMEKLQDKCFMNRNEAKNFILSLCKQANEGETTTKKHTAIFLIQQVNKDGNFVGANALKHDTTAMCFAKFDEHGDRYIMWIKNRRNGDAVKKPLYFSLNEKQEVVYDEVRYKEDREREEVSRRTKEELASSKEQFNSIFMKSAKATDKKAIQDDMDDMLMDDEDFDDED